MALVARSEETSQPAPGANGRANRAAPHSTEAEESLLGAMLINDDALTVGLAATAHHFWSPANVRIWQAINDLAKNDAPADSVTVADQLRHDGVVDFGGEPVASVLATLVGNVPSTTNAWHYLAILDADLENRRAIEWADSVKAAAFDRDLDRVRDLRYQAASDIDTRHASTWTPVDLAEILAGTHTQPMPTILERSDGIGLFYDGKVNVVSGESESGKAQPLDAPVLTPTGWRPMGSLEVGDEVTGADGKATAVTGVYPQGELDIYRVGFSDGSTVECCPEHLWRVYDTNAVTRGTSGKVLTTLDLERSVIAGRRSQRLYVPIVEPVTFEPSGPLPIDPYLLGLLIGDGGLTKGVTFTSADPELFASIEKVLPAGHRLYRWERQISASITGSPRGRPNMILVALRELGLFGHKSEAKFIPAVYLRAAVEDRWALLQGMLDTDGEATRKGSTLLTTGSPRLADDIADLVGSLGGTVSRREKHPFFPSHGERKAGLVSYGLSLRTPFALGCPFRLERKVAIWHDARTRGPLRPYKAVDSVTYIGRKQAQCIAVAAPDHLYVTSGYTVTHNTWMLLLAVAQQLHAGRHVIYVDFEDSPVSLIERLLTAGATIDEVAVHFHYIRPDEPTGPASRALLDRLVDATDPALVVLDGVTEAMSLNGWSLKDNDDIASFYAALPRPIARRGPAVVMIDHVPKDENARGKGGIGGQHKRAGIDGAGYILDVVTPFGRGRAGSSRLWVDKDRGGHLRGVATRVGQRDLIGELHVTSSDAGLAVTLIPPNAANVVGSTWDGPSECIAVVRKLIEERPDEDFTGNQMVELVRSTGHRFRPTTVREAVGRLAGDSLSGVTSRPGPRNSMLYRYGGPVSEALGFDADEEAPF